MNNQLIQGSLSHVSKKENQSLAESFMDADIIILLDASGSMSTHDAPNGMSREQAAEKELIRLQRQNQGKIALICFADYPVFSPNGSITSCGGSTAMAQALEFVKIADNCGLKIVLISDGAPNNEEKTLQVAKTFTTQIDCIYIGREGGRGQHFLDKLMKVTGGKRFEADAPGMLGKGIDRLLLGG